MKNVVYFILGLLLFGYITTCWFFSSLILIPPEHPFNAQLADTMVAKYGSPELFTITTDDKLNLKGWYFENPQKNGCGAILVHGHGSNRNEMTKYMYLFWGKGCDVALYDHRAHGESEGEYGTGGVLEKNDLVRVTDWFRGRTGLKMNQIAWAGESWGGSTALQAAAMEENIAFVMADSPFKNWKSAVTERAYRWYGKWIDIFVPVVFWMVEQRSNIDIEKASALDVAHKIKAPVLLVHSKADPETSSLQSVALAATLKKENLVFHHTDWGSAHCQDVKNNPKGYQQLFEQFLVDQDLDWAVKQMDSTASVN